MKLMEAKFNSRCAQTGNPIRKGDPIAYDPQERKAYSAASDRYKAATNAATASRADYVRDPGEDAADRWNESNY